MAQIMPREEDGILITPSNSLGYIEIARQYINIVQAITPCVLTQGHISKFKHT